MATITIPWVNQGRPFEAGPKTLTHHALRAGVLARNATYLKAVDGLRDDHPKEVKDAVLKGAANAAQLSEVDALLYELLLAVDSSLAAQGYDAVLRRLSKEDHTALVGALGEGKKAAVKAAPGPLESPASSSA